MRTKIGTGLAGLLTVFALWTTWQANGGDPGGTTCDRLAAPGTFAAQVTAATDGDVICLASGDYGTWSGTSKAITVRASAGAAPVMSVSFGAGDGSFVLDGMRGMAGTVGGGASDITIRDSAFGGSIVFGNNDTDVDGIRLVHNTHNWMVGPSYSTNGKIIVNNTVSGTLADPSLTIEDSEISNGDLDGIHIGGGAPGLQIIHNRFRQICDAGETDPESNHTDNTQFEGGGQVRIARNYYYADETCATQAITSFDGGTVGNIFEDNVIDVRRPWGIELYADDSSIVRHNTLFYWPDADCFFEGTSCGKIALDHKAEDPPGTGTQVTDNIATAVGFSNGSTGFAARNMCRLTCDGDGSMSATTPLFRGGPHPTTYEGFCLRDDSPGKGAGAGGTDIGIRC